MSRATSGRRRSDRRVIRANTANSRCAAPLPADRAPAASEDSRSRARTGLGDVGLDPQRADRIFEFAIGRRFGFLDGHLGLHWTINGHTFPDVPMLVVSEGDVVRMTISNCSGQAHPMHLHGHHIVVLSRDGRAFTGSPCWTDSLQVRNGERYEIAFVADNPGIWMDHCHNLPHAQQGLVAHLAYDGISEPYRVGGAEGNKRE